MKYFGLLLDKVPVVISKDKWLLELYIVQRNMPRNRIEIIKMKSQDVTEFDDNCLNYFYGFAITNKESSWAYQFEEEQKAPYRETIRFLKNVKSSYKDRFSKKDFKYLEKAYRIAKLSHKKVDENIIQEQINMIIDYPNLINEYFELNELVNYHMERND